MKKKGLEIDGVFMLEFDLHRDSRGYFAEVFRKEWLEGVFTDQLQVNCSVSGAGTLRGMHFHLEQWDLWLPLKGRMRVGLADLRKDSGTFGATLVLDMQGDDPSGLVIPPGVAHGYAVMEDLLMVYLVNRYYDGSDEHGIAWDDPELDIDWGLDAPLLSPRDMNNGPLDREMVERLMKKSPGTR